MIQTVSRVTTIPGLGGERALGDWLTQGIPFVNGFFRINSEVRASGGKSLYPVEVLVN